MPNTGGETRNVEALVGEHRARFRERFGDGGEVRTFFAPGRVNLMGAHLDYNGGPVMPLAIDRGTFFAARRRVDDRVRLASTLEEVHLDVDRRDLPVQGTGNWYDYPLGVLLELDRRGAVQGGIDLFVGGNLPIGAGLSSSASISIGTAYALARLWDAALEPRDLIECALWAEREFVGVHCGIMDPFAVTLTRPGHILWLDCSDESVAHVPLDSERVTIAVADTGVRRALARGEFNERVAQCKAAFEVLSGRQPGAACLSHVSPEVFATYADELDEIPRQRARHVVEETARTHAARAALEAGDVVAFGRAMTAAHRSLRELYQVSIDELDALVEAALEWDGVLGARLTGAGFGGCIVVALETASRPGFHEHLVGSFRKRFGPAPPVEFFQGGSGPREIG